MNVELIAIIGSVLMICVGIFARIFLKKLDRDDKGIKKDGTK